MVVTIHDFLLDQILKFYFEQKKTGLEIMLKNIKIYLKNNKSFPVPNHLEKQEQSKCS